MYITYIRRLSRIGSLQLRSNLLNKNVKKKKKKEKRKTQITNNNTEVKGRIRYTSNGKK